MTKPYFFDAIEQLSIQHGGQPFMVDGIVDDATYARTTPKILWILKEMNFEDPESDERLHITEVLKSFADNNEIATHWKNTFNRLVYATYGILNGFAKYNETPNRYTSPEMNKVLAQIAFININKFLGAGAATDADLLQTHFRNNKELLYHQIEYIKPDIIIGGGTMHLFFADKGISPHLNIGHTEGAVHDGKCWIKAYHPAYPFSEEQYMDDIVEIAKQLHQQATT